MLGIYVHIPFCERKCNYCAFSSFVDKIEKENYIKSLISEIKEFRQKNKAKYKKINTIYIGGGTPSILEKEEIKNIIDVIKQNFDLAEKYEFTIECNPNSLTEEKLKIYKQEGINRISIGVQSLNDEQLKFINRLHDSKMAIEKIKLASKYFDNISCDLLIGIKGMKKDDFIKDLKTLIDLKIKHISAYMLQIEEGTLLDAMCKENPDLLPNEDESIEVYEETAKFLRTNGFERYEVSNFAQKGYESKHNLKYWSGENYIGFGLSAHSYLNKTRFANANNFKDYYKRGIALKEKLTKNQLIEEHIMLGLRCKNGINLNYLNKLNFELNKNILNDFLIKKILIKEKNKIFINQNFFGVNNQIILQLLP